MTDYKLDFDVAMSMALEDADHQYEELLKGNETTPPAVRQAGSKKTYVILRLETIEKFFERIKRKDASDGRVN